MRTSRTCQTDCGAHGRQQAELAVSFKRAVQEAFLELGCHTPTAGLVFRHVKIRTGRQKACRTLSCNDYRSFGACYGGLGRDGPSCRKGFNLPTYAHRIISQFKVQRLPQHLVKGHCDVHGAPVQHTGHKALPLEQMLSAVFDPGEMRGASRVQFRKCQPVSGNFGSVPVGVRIQPDVAERQQRRQQPQPVARAALSVCGSSAGRGPRSWNDRSQESSTRLSSPRLAGSAPGPSGRLLTFASYSARLVSAVRREALLGSGPAAGVAQSHARYSKRSLRHVPATASSTKSTSGFRLGVVVVAVPVVGALSDRKHVDDQHLRQRIESQVGSAGQKRPVCVTRPTGMHCLRWARARPCCRAKRQENAKQARPAMPARS